LPAEDGRPAAVRIALVGIGSAATRAHLPALDRLTVTGAVQLVGVCDRKAERREAVLAGHPGALGFAENEAMLDAVKPDLLVIATPPSAHLDEIAAAVDRGVHVLCEKPLGLNDADLETLRALAGAHGDLALATVQQYRYAEPWRWVARALRGAVAEGEQFSVAVAVERPGTDPLSAGDWRAEPEKEGGILGDHGAHYLSLLHGVDPAARVVACTRHGRGSAEVATVELAIGAGGRARIDLSYAGERRRNLVRLERPAQCLELTWDGDRVTFTHNGGAGEGRTVASLSDRAVVNGLYAPMYHDVLGGIGSPPWRARSVTETLGVAGMLAGALRIARDSAAQASSP
jgi:predicted dehydrogenase